MALSVSGDIHISIRDIAKLPEDDEQLRRLVMEDIALQCFEQMQALREQGATALTRDLQIPSGAVSERGIEVSGGIDIKVRF